MASTTHGTAAEAISVPTRSCEQATGKNEEGCALSASATADVDVAREKGNDLYRRGLYKEALEVYTGLIQELSKVCSTEPCQEEDGHGGHDELQQKLAVLCSNAAQCAVQLKDWVEAMGHADRALRLSRGSSAKA
eukprot:RCo005565